MTFEFTKNWGGNQKLQIPKKWQEGKSADFWGVYPKVSIGGSGISDVWSFIPPLMDGNPDGYFFTAYYKVDDNSGSID